MPKKQEFANIKDIKGEKNMSNNAKYKHFLSFLAFCSLVMVGLALVISYIFRNNGGISDSISLIANIISYVIVISTAYYYVRSKRNIWFLVVWVIAIVLIILFLVLKAL